MPPTRPTQQRSLTGRWVDKEVDALSFTGLLHSESIISRRFVVYAPDRPSSTSSVAIHKPCPVLPARPPWCDNQHLMVQIGGLLKPLFANRVERLHVELVSLLRKLGFFRGGT